MPWHRVLRGWAKSKGWELRPNSLGKPEVWGTTINNKFAWNLRIKPECSMRNGLDAGSNVARFDARIAGKDSYINPFTGKVGDKTIGTHIPLQEKYWR